MYWRVRKITPEMLFRQFGVHLMLAASLLLNLVLFVSRPKPQSVAEHVQQNFKQFAKQVTTHLVDTSYITYLQSTAKLEDELSGPVKRALRKMKLLPSSRAELKAMNLELQRSRQVCTIRFDRVTTQDPDSKGHVPVDVQGVIAIHSSDETTSTRPQPFHFRYWIGIKATDKKPIVTNFQEVNTAQAQQ